MTQDKFWQYFDDNSHLYAKTIMEAERDYYEKSERFITPFMISGGCVLDIGNGGIINYDYSLLKELVCADIHISPQIAELYKRERERERERETKKPEIIFIESNVLNMSNIMSDRFDVVIVQKVIHHLAESNYGTTKANCVKAMREYIRVLKPGGCLIICESTVKRWFERLEIIFFRLMMLCCDLIKFDRVFQYSPGSLKRLLDEELCGVAALEKMEEIGTGAHVLFLGRKFPSWMLPCSVTFYLVRKKADLNGH